MFRCRRLDKMGSLEKSRLDIWTFRIIFTFIVRFVVKFRLVYSRQYMFWDNERILEKKKLFWLIDLEFRYFKSWSEIDFKA